MRTQTEKTTFSCKDDEGKSLHVYWSGGKGLVKIKTVPGQSLHNLSCSCLMLKPPLSAIHACFTADCRQVIL